MQPIPVKLQPDHRGPIRTPPNPFRDRVAVLGFPDSMQRFHSYVPAPWTSSALARLRELGFTAVQLNLAWGARPDDEPLNLEDLVDAPAGCCPQVIELNCRPGPEARDRRRGMIRERLILARSAGLRTVFHFGAPYNRHAHYGDTPPNCIEYYGLLPERSGDANLAATALFLREPELSGEAALARLAQPFGAAAVAVAEAWRLTSDMMERHPWDCSWLSREIGRAATDHALSAAILRPMLCPTPSWQSTRGTVYQRTEDTPAHPWQIEDIGLRCGQAAEFGSQALRLLDPAIAKVPADRRGDLVTWRGDLARFVRRSQSYAYHLRATSLAVALRRRLADKRSLPPEHLAELQAVLIASRDNHALACREENREMPWPAMEAALTDLNRDPRGFLDRWLQPGPGDRQRGPFSLTSE